MAVVGVVRFAGFDLRRCFGCRVNAFSELFILFFELLVALFENAKIGLPGAIVILVAVETIRVVKRFVGWTLRVRHAAFDGNYFRGVNAGSLGKFDVCESPIFA